VLDVDKLAAWRSSALLPAHVMGELGEFDGLLRELVLEEVLVTDLAAAARAHPESEPLGVRESAVERAVAQ
jgi:hypothetical protein